MNDKDIERLRYDERAKQLRLRPWSVEGSSMGAAAVAVELRRPYEFYDLLIRGLVNSGSVVLEIGAGTGEFTNVALELGATVTATDISADSLALLAKKYSKPGVALNIRQADMEALPFADQSFDCIISAGSLSYGDNETVLAEIHRLLKPGGRFVCVDSLNHNPIYRANRWWHYVRNRRSRSTLRRMPTLALIDRYRQMFGEVRVHFFGSLAWAMPILVRLVGAERARGVSDWFDRSFRVTRSAFKFVMVATKIAGDPRL